MSDSGDTSRGPGDGNETRGTENVVGRSVPTDESRDVLCSACPERAFKFCLTCVASYCTTHVKMHYSVPALKKHTLLDTTEDLEQRLCQQHNRELELFCKTDQTPVCSLCAVQQHSGHEITGLEGEDSLAQNHSKFPFQINPSPKKQLAVKKHPIKKASPNCYQLPTEKSNIGGHENTRRWTFGKQNSETTIKTILLVGETGAGKTTLINTMVNYLLGVEPEDGLWFEITEEDKKSQAESQTAAITVYEVFVETSSLSLRIIDTPGYGSTAGIDFDLEVAEMLLLLFRSEDGVHEITAVGLVVKLGQNRLTDFQSYILNAILSLFGKDIAKRIVPLITHSDGMSVENVITALDKAEVPCAKDASGKPFYFMFNNRQSQAYEKECEDLHRSAWDLGYRNIESFLWFLQDCSETEVKMTEKVLKERKSLEAHVRKLQDAIEMEEGKQNELRQIQKALEENKGKFQNNENFAFSVDETVMDRAPIKLPWYELTKKAMCCNTCKENCHYPGCWWVKDLSMCSVMKDNKCTVCTGKCPVSAHVKEKWFYKPTAKKVEKNTADLKQQYTEQENIAKALEKEINESKVEMKKMLLEAYSCILKLEEIALTKDSMSILIHLQFLIQKMKVMGDEDKVKKLENIQKRNEDLRKTRVVRWLSLRLSNNYVTVI